MTYKEALLSGLAALTLNISIANAQEAITTEIADDTAQTAQQDNIYVPAYFNQYAPRTALDMVTNIPGYQLNSGSNKRGLGNGGANVLINGERISGKSNAFDQLSRITAPSVVRIEIVDGTSLDIPGLSGQVANVITKNTGVTGTWSWNPEFRPGLEPKWLDGEVTVSGEKGNLTYSAKLKNGAFRNGHRGPERRFTPDGEIFEIRDEDAQFYGDNPGGSANITWKPKDNHVINMNAEYNQFNFNSRERSQHTAFTARGDNDQTLFTFAEDEWNAEIGGDYEFPAGPESLNGKLKLIGYYRAEHSPTVARFDVFDTTIGQTSGSRFFRVADEGEAIGRAEYSWKNAKGQDWQIGVEGAFNFLDIASRLTVLDTNTGVFDPIDLDGATARVEELRSEATLTHSRSLSPKLNLQISIGVEYSELTQTGASGQAREFVRPKGFISTTYKPDDSLSIRTKLEREVGQLNFFDFISSVSLQDNLDRTGNNNLVPNQLWRGEIEFDKKFGKGITLNATIFGELISDLVDNIPVGVDGDAVGNVDKATQYGIEVSSTIKGDRWGLKGTELNLSFELRDSAVDDPLTGVSRRLNQDLKTNWDIGFRHDIPKTDIAYGFFAFEQQRAPSFRLTSISESDNPEGVWGQIFLEHKDIFGMKARITMQNLFGVSDDFQRKVFTNRRDIGVLDFTEDRERPFGVLWRFNISGTF